MTKPTAGKERERFEAWCLKNGLFTAGHKSAAWGAWQAALADQPEPQITDAMVEAALDKLRHFGNAYTAHRCRPQSIGGEQMKRMICTPSRDDPDLAERGLVHYDGVAQVGSQTLCGHIDRVGWVFTETSKRANCLGCIAVRNHVLGKPTR